MPELQSINAEQLPPQRTWGVGVGRKPGSRNRIQAQLREEVEFYLQSAGESANPILILLKIAQDEEASKAVRVKASSEAAKYLVPHLVLSQREPEDESSQSSVVIVEALQSLLSVAPPARALPVAKEIGASDVA
jgi:hypothetical protein